MSKGLSMVFHTIDRVQEGKRLGQKVIPMFKFWINILLQEVNVLIIFHLYKTILALIAILTFDKSLYCFFQFYFWCTLYLISFKCCEV